jgi:hypothetical protein
MNQEKRLPLAAGGFLIIVGAIADATKVALDFFFGIGFILDPVLITPVTWMIFMITFLHNDVPMMSGKRGWAGWTNLIVSAVPGVDILPDWTTYALYVTFADRASDAVQGIIK